jgi:3-methyl-2-oxobutanoate hydroxymethyltransferase
VTVSTRPAKVTTATLRQQKAQCQRITALTAYDHLFASLLDEAGVDVLLVGDSVATVVQGRDTTVPVTMDQMVYHTEMVARGCKRALVVGDLPFLSYQIGIEDALRNADSVNDLRLNIKLNSRRGVRDLHKGTEHLNLV